MQHLRHYSFLDKVVMQLDACLTTVFVQHTGTRDYPAQDMPQPQLSPAQQRQSAGMMRVNHSGEVCAQALYHGQLTLARDAKTRQMLQQACDEETDHLAWCQLRLQELNDRTSYLNIFWYMNSFLIGVLASSLGDAWSLGFVEETEVQVTKHLDGHLKRLSSDDVKSLAVVKQMRIDEAQHSANASTAGARKLPFLIKQCMALHAKLMTSLVYWV